MLCQVHNFQTLDEVLRHVQSPDHEDLHQELTASTHDISMERQTLPNGKEEYRCRLCDTKTMVLDRLPSHFDGAKHRQSIRNLVAASGRKNVKPPIHTMAVRSVTSTEAMSDAPSSSSRAEDDDNVNRVGQRTSSVLSEVTLLGPFEEPTAVSTPHSPGLFAPSTSDPLLLPPALSRSDALRVLAKVEKCREVQNQISHLPEAQKYHINHLLLQHVLSCDAPTEGLFLSLAMVYVNDYVSQQKPDPNSTISNTGPTVVDTTGAFLTATPSVSDFRKHLPQDSYLSPTVMKSTATLSFDGSTDVICAIGIPRFSASSSRDSPNKIEAPRLHPEGENKPRPDDDPEPSQSPPVLLASPTGRRRGKNDSKQDCSLCAIL
jgi:hypothetical protein